MIALLWYQLHLVLIISSQNIDASAALFKYILGDSISSRLFQGHMASDDDDMVPLEGAMISILLTPAHMFEAVIILSASSCDSSDHYLWVSQDVGRTPVWNTRGQTSLNLCQSKQNGLKEQMNFKRNLRILEQK